MIVKQRMSRIIIERCLYRLYRINSTTFVKFILCLIIIYLLNAILGVQYYIWAEKSFENEYHLEMTHIDVKKINEENYKNILGLPKYIISNEFIINNEYLCYNDKSGRSSSPHLLILVKSAIENWNARQAIRLTWANKITLNNYNIKLAFVLGKFYQNI